MCSICNKYCFKAALPYTSYLLLILAACVPITLHTIQADVHTTHRPASHASASISQAVNTPLEPAPPYVEMYTQHTGLPPMHQPRPHKQSTLH